MINWTSSLDAYRGWVNANGSVDSGTEVEDVPQGNGSQMFWVGKEEDMKKVKVLYYLHGGGFFLLLDGSAMLFLDDVAKGVEKATPGVKVSIAVLDYSTSDSAILLWQTANPLIALLPNAQMPTPLQQAVAGLHHILSLGVNPEDIQLIGDSAGGNLVLQLLLHGAHPVQGNNILPLDLSGRKLGGAYLMSPFFIMTPRNVFSSWKAYDGIDSVSAEAFATFGYQVLMSTVKKPGLLPYVDQSYRPDGWYEGLERVVERILVTAGGNECLKDDIVEVSEAIRVMHPRTTLLVDARGVHDEPLADYGAGETRVGELTPVIKEWIKECFNAK